MKIKINGQEKIVEFKSIYTRGIDREFNSILFSGIKAKPGIENQGIELDLDNIQNANDFIIKAMTNLSDDDINELEINDYNKILDKINKIKNGSN